MDSKTLKVVAWSGFLGVSLGVTSAFAGAAMYASRPYLHRSQKELQTVKYLLQKASHDCGGHRVTAIQKIDAAILEVDLAVQYADGHPQEDSKH